MYEPIWQAVAGELSGDRAAACVDRLWQHARWNTFDGINRTADEIAAVMTEIGLEGVEVRRYPADGVTSHGGWVMPEAWNVDDATLEIASPKVPQPVLARYRDCPQSLMMYSSPTPPGGLVAEVVAVEDAAGPESFDGVDVRGKLVLIDGLGLDAGRPALERGAAGLVSDAMKLAGSPQEPAPGHFDRAVQWHNYTIPPWKDEAKGFGFSISPADGRRLRDLLKTHSTVQLKAVVRSRAGAGHLPLVTGLLPGDGPEEILVTGHLCEPGANDNASGCALGLEVVRTIKALRDTGRLARPARGIRPIFSFEVRGYQAYLGAETRLRHLVAGIDLDMVGSDLSAARSVCNLVFNWPTLPAYTDWLAVELLERLRRDDPLFRFRTHPGELVDNVFGEPAVGAPMCVLGCWPDATYHTSLDVPETLSPRAMALLGRAAATYCAFLAGAGFEEAAWLARTAAAFGEREIVETAHRLADADGGSGRDVAGEIAHVAEKNAARLRPIARLVRPLGVMPTPDGIRQCRDRIRPASRLSEGEAIERLLAELGERLRSAGRRQQAQLAADLEARAAAPRPEPPADEAERARRLVPVRTFRGALCFESLDAGARAELRQRTGLVVGWGAPNWLQLACFRASGKRTALEIWRWLRFEAGGVALARLCDAFEFLAAHGFARLRPVLAKADFLTALREVGLEAGSVAMVHSSLSRFGYVEGGAETVIDAVREALGPGGTLVMPTLSCSWAGRPAFDPAETPSRVGAVSEAFRKRPGVRRSPHPTHSVAALGPKADEITRRHSPDEPVFADTGAFGRLYALDAQVLMLAPPETNTSMHMGEERAGVPLVDFAQTIDEAGRPAGLIRRAPWHVNFAPHYARLREGHRLASAPLGDGMIYLMRMRDAVDAAVENIRADPLMVAQAGCLCTMCRRVRAQAGTTPA